jgi:hypothetical protein
MCRDDSGRDEAGHDDQGSDLTATGERRKRLRASACAAAVVLVQIRCLMNHCEADGITFCVTRMFLARAAAAPSGI